MNAKRSPLKSTERRRNEGKEETCLSASLFTDFSGLFVPVASACLCVALERCGWANEVIVFFAPHLREISRNGKNRDEGFDRSVCS